MKIRALSFAAALALLSSVAAPVAAQQDTGTPEQHAAGKIVYDKFCSQCHGDTGAGDGVAAPYVKPAPRDFTEGKYKIRTTPNGTLPTHEDIVQSIRVGLHYTAMPAFPNLSEQELRDVAYYLTTFSEDFQDPEAYGPEVDLPNAPAYSAESAEAGREVYVNTGCVRCHGETGRGDGLSAPTLVDDWGEHIRAADLTLPWTWRAGSTPKDIYKTLRTGFNGTPMPGFEEDAVSLEDRWRLVHYMMSLSINEDIESYDQPPYSRLLRAVPVEGELDISLGRELFAEAPVSTFPIVGQIMEPGRNFFPSASNIQAQAVFNRDEIAFLLTWHDMRAETVGEAGPDLVAPPYDDEIALLRAGNALAAAGLGGDAEGGDDGEGGGFWGDEEGGDDEGSFWGEEEAAAEGDEGSFWGEEEAAEEEGGDFWGEEEADDGDGGDFWGEDDGGDSAAAAGPTGIRDEFADAVALQFPKVLPESIVRPYFLFGDLQNPVELWFHHTGEAQVRLFEARGSASITPADGAEGYEVSSEFSEGRWSVIFKRQRKSVGGITFREGAFTPIALTTWDGFNRERGNRRGLTRWYDLYLEPMERPSPLGPVMKASLGVLGVELLLIALVRRRKKQQESKNA